MLWCQIDLRQFTPKWETGQRKREKEAAKKEREKNKRKRVRKINRECEGKKMMEFAWKV